MKNFHLSRCLLGLLCLSICAVASADDAGPPIKHDQGVAYVSGGIGAEERADLQAMASKFDLRLVFAITGGAFIADVKVTISDEQGKTLLSAVSEGPWFYAQLPAGKYKVAASFAGHTQTRAVTVAANSGTRAVFEWKPAAQ